MARGIRGKLLLGGLGLTLFAKAAISLPILSVRNEVSPPATLVVQAAAPAESKDEKPAEVIPPLVENLPDRAPQCETPEEVLLSLNKERESVAGERVELEARRAEIALAREKLQIEKSALVDLKDSINDLLNRVDAAQTDDLKRLVELYRNMKPADAARIMDDLDIETTIMVLATMQPRIAAPIMAKMSPVRARAVSKIILERSQLPGDQDLVGIRLN
ncbi:MAG: MotE family protein [Brevirhabdus sp.]